MTRSDAQGILYTDLYQLTMAQLYFRYGLHERRAQFDHFFRSYPDYGRHQAGYAVNAGLDFLLDWMEGVRFGHAEIEYLSGLKGITGERLFARDFLSWLQDHDPFAGITIEAIPEGRIVHPDVPLTVVTGPLVFAQLLETSLLNHLNYQILVATKASRVVEAARGRPVMEFGLRRASEHGSTAGARAALIGGADFTSHVGASWMLGPDPKGTHAHSMVQAFMALGMGELEAFRAYAEVYPDDCTLLVDTIDTLQSGVPNAIKVFEELRAGGHRPVGVRLDSGDLAYLAIETARMLDAAGFPDTSIVLSSGLDELAIWQILSQIDDEAGRVGVDAGAVTERLVYGVGSRLITSHGDSYLDGVYKLVAIDDGGNWVPALKVSDSVAKIPNPGNKRVWRVYDERGSATADVLSLDHEDVVAMDPLVLRHPTRHEAFRALRRDEVPRAEELLVPVVVDGERRGDRADIDAMRARRRNDLEKLDIGVRRLINPHVYHVSLTEDLWELKNRLVAEARRGR